MKRYSTRDLCVSAVFMAMVIAVGSFGIPVPGGRIYLTDAIICTASMILDPFSAFVVGGVGSFLGDMIFYPTPMFVSLAVHGLQAVIISLICRKKDKHPFLRGLLAVTIGGIIMVSGYTLGKIYIYATLEYAILKLPFECVQAIFGGIVGLLMVYKVKIQNIIYKSK